MCIQPLFAVVRFTLTVTTIEVLNVFVKEKQRLLEFTDRKL